MRIPFTVMKDEIKRVFLKAGLEEEKAEICAFAHAESSLYGVYSHGLNRVARFVDYIQKGWVDVNAEPSLSLSLGAIEVYDGNRGPGILNAKFATNKAIEVAKKFGIGLVTLKNTTHWMRGGTYGWDAANRGYAAICWTNTESCMPAWGAKNNHVGNNPFVMALPRENGNIVLDMAMSQFSYGKLQVTRLKNEKLPVMGGYDKSGTLTDVPGLIEESMRILPMGYWKGSGFSILLDAMAAILSDGLSTVEIDKVQAGSCGGCSQVFMVINPSALSNKTFVENTLNDVVEYVKASTPTTDDGEIYYPGELAAKTCRENKEKGIPVDEMVWNEILAL